MIRDRPSVIELLGQPGSGKSSLVRAVAISSEPICPAADWHQHSLATKTALLARTLTNLVCLAVAVQFVRRARLYNRDSLSRLFRLLVKSHWLPSQHGTFLLQEGHLQELWSILYSAGRTDPDPVLLAPLIRCLYRGLDAQIVLLELSPESAFARIRARTMGKSRFDRLSDRQLTAELAATTQLPCRLADGARVAGLRVERLDASLPIQTAAVQLREIIQRLHQTTARAG